MAKQNDNSEIEWVEREVSVSELKPYEKNPRKISNHDFDRLVEDIKKNGYHQRIIATADLRVIGGHQRIKAFKKLNKTKIKVLVPDQELPDAQFRELLIKDNLHAGEFDFDMLAQDFDFQELVDWGMPANWLTPSQENQDEAEKEWQEMPDYEGLEPCYRKIIVNFDNEKQVKDFFKLIKQSCTEKTKSIWFPEKKKDDNKSQVWDDK